MKIKKERKIILCEKLNTGNVKYYQEKESLNNLTNIKRGLIKMENKQIKLQLLEVELLNMKKAVKYCDEIKKLIPRFEGNVINKRFDTALKGIDKNLSFHMQYNSFIVDLFKEPRSINGGDSWYYTKSHSQNILHESIQSSSNDGICQEGVLVSANICNRLDARKAQIQENIDQISGQIKNIDTIIMLRDSLQKQKDNFIVSVNYYIRDYFDLKIS